MILAASILFIALLVAVFFSPVGAYRLARLLESIATEFRHHGGAMAGAYACYSNLRRDLRRSQAQRA